MDFLNGDEHFIEFERVFDTVNKARDSQQMESVPFLPGRETRRRLSRENVGLLLRSEQITGTNMKDEDASDLFSDFFDNDETFLEFEKEFENFRNGRKSNLLSGLSQMGSSRDIFGDFKSYCDKNVRSGSLVSVNSCASQDEAQPSCSDDHGQGGLMWRSVEDWEKILKKIRRNSRLLLDGCSHRSPYGLSKGSGEQKHLKTQSLADLTCRGHEADHRPFSDATDNPRSGNSHSFNDLSLPASVRLTSFRSSGSSSSSFSEDVDDAHSSSSRWTEKLEDASRYSSSSTLCSSRGDLSSSFSCSCCSDLHIDEDTDDDLPYEHSPTSRNRSHSLMDIGPRGTKLGGQHTCSVDNLLCLIRPRGDRNPPGAAEPGCDIGRIDSRDDDEGYPDWSCQLSEADSEQYHTARSDFSSQFSTAKSELSDMVAECRNKTGRQPPSDTDRPVTSNFYHTYHGRDKRNTHAGSTRPLSGCACQYTCHQHCVPAVTLNCKSISEDSVQVKTPSPIEQRSQLETSLSLGNIHARPGCARSVTLTSSQDSIVQQHAKVCSLHAAQTNVPGPTSPHLSRSASEGHTNAQTSDLPCAVSRPTAFSSDYASSQSHPHRNINSQSTSNSAAVNTLIVNHHVDICTGDGSGSSTTDHLTEQQVTSQLHGAEGEVNSEEATEKDETDSGYRSGTIPDDKLPRVPSQETLDRQELKRKIAKFNHFVPAASLKVSDKESFQGFLKVTLNLIRPITMELGARPPSIYELLTREHIIEENTQQVAFYMPRDTHKSLHITSDTTTKEVITSLLKKFHILDHPRKFAMYEQEFSDRNKLVRLRRLADKDFPLRAMLTWDPERMKNYRIVLQENETGEIVWDAFSLPELNNFLKVLEREEKETILEMKHKYAYMRQYMERRLTELRGDKNKGKVKK